MACVLDVMMLGDVLIFAYQLRLTALVALRIGTASCGTAESYWCALHGARYGQSARNYHLFQVHQPYD